MTAHRAYYLPDGTWVDPDCLECGGDGAPCCEPPYTPPALAEAAERAQTVVAAHRAHMSTPPTATARELMATWDALGDALDRLAEIYPEPKAADEWLRIAEDWL